MGLKDNLHLLCKDQRHAKDENNTQDDNLQELDLDYDEYDFNFECDDSDNSNFKG